VPAGRETAQTVGLFGGVAELEGAVGERVEIRSARDRLRVRLDEGVQVRGVDVGADRRVRRVVDQRPNSATPPSGSSCVPPAPLPIGNCPDAVLMALSTCSPNELLIQLSTSACSGS
jgi:hypothetical protein